MAKNLLNESTIRQWMKLASIDQHADDVVSKFGLLKEEDEKSEKEEETEESGETEDDSEEGGEDAPPAPPEEPEVELDSIPSNEDDESVDTTMEDLKAFISDAIKTALSELAGSGEIEIGSEPGGEMDMGADPGMDAGAGEMPPAPAPAPEMGGEPGMEGGAPPAAPPPAPEEEEQPAAPVMEGKGKAGLASKGKAPGKAGKFGGTQKATMKKATGATGMAGKGKVMEEAEVVEEEEVIEEEQLDELESLKSPAVKAADEKIKYKGKTGMKKTLGATPQAKAHAEKYRDTKPNPVTESRKSMMEAYIARYGKQQLVKEVSKRVAQRLAEAKQRAEKKKG